VSELDEKKDNLAIAVSHAGFSSDSPLDWLYSLYSVPNMTCINGTLRQDEVTAHIDIVYLQLLFVSPRCRRSI
jgi:hypothetical protein